MLKKLETNQLRSPDEALDLYPSLQAADSETMGVQHLGARLFRRPPRRRHPRNPAALWPLLGCWACWE